MATSDYSNPDSLAVLTAMVNQTLIETGRFFRSGGSTQYRAQLKRTIPVAHEQFQTALDNLSEQIFIAKAFLERDYEAIAAEKAALQPAEDIVMTQPEFNQEPDTAPQLEAAAIGTNKPQSEQHEADTAVQSHKGVDTGQQNSTDKPIKGERSAEPAALRPDQSKSGPTEINFDSVLNDTGGANDFDLNLDFGDDDLGNENFLSGSNIGATNTVGAAHQEKEVDQSGTTTDLPGMDNHAASIPAGGDIFDLELKRAEAFSGQGETQDGQQSNNNEDVMVPGESSFDDLFMDNENFGGGDVGDPSMLEGDSLMNINELDDSWFS
ncbi:hypothetical protein BBP40_008582 [Aspergillus hancockii]|nr:hypothetical protein BBP40_008582 [Aspergillus hancockii]